MQKKSKKSNTEKSLSDYEILKIDENNPDILVTQESDRVEFKTSFHGYKMIHK